MIRADVVGWLMQSNLLLALVVIPTPYKLARTYLCCVVDLERRLARRVEVTVASESVVFAHNDLLLVRSELVIIHHVIGHTASLLPGSLIVAYCCSLYFLNAGSRDCSKLASLPARALISA